MERLVLLQGYLLRVVADSELSVTRRIVMLCEGHGIVAVNNQFSGGCDNRPSSKCPLITFPFSSATDI